MSEYVELKSFLAVMQNSDLGQELGLYLLAAADIGAGTYYAPLNAMEGNDVEGLAIAVSDWWGAIQFYQP